MPSTAPATVTLTLDTAQADLLRQGLEMLHAFNGRVVHHALNPADPKNLDEARAEEARAERRAVDEVLALLDAAVDTAEGRQPGRKPAEGVRGPSRFGGLL